jgi:hypothetical protein
MANISGRYGEYLKSEQCDIYISTSFATIDLYLQMTIEISEILKYKRTRFEYPTLILYYDLL